MKRFLSVDWDFFIGATAKQRNLLFPDGGDESIHHTLRDYIWDTLYRNPELSTIKVSPDYDILLKICRNFNGQCRIADSHRYAYSFIKENTTPDEEFEVFNIDFHHDLYDYRTGGNRVNCGNWATILREDRPNMKYVWIKCNDSDTLTIGDIEVDAEIRSMQMFFECGAPFKFDYLYLCRSAMWSPPHLDPEFVKAVKILLKRCPTIYEIGINEPRPYEIPTGQLF